MKPRVVIAGGGIGGLTLALMLDARGIPCVVCEAARDVRPLGVGINALPHAIVELAALDLLPALDVIAIRTRSLTYANHRGQRIWSEPRGLFAGHGVPQFSVHRGRLQTMLWDEVRRRLGTAGLRPGLRLADAAQSADGVTARFTDGDGAATEIAGDVLVGADGIHSVMREKMHPAEPGMRWNGILMWRGALDWPAFGSGDEMIIAGDGIAKLVLYPIGLGSTPERRLTNWVIYARAGDADAPPPARESWSQRGRIEDFARLVARLDLPFIDADAMIRATAEIFVYPMCDRDPLDRWSEGRVTLLGDAAHPMYPVGSNGASQAILDARCLADLLAARPAAEALQAYDAERRPATAAIVQSNRVGGPERVIDLVAARAPDGFACIEDVASHEELAGVARGYAKLAGFAVAR